MRESVNEIPDIHDERPSTPIPVNWVGFKSIVIPAGRLRIDGVDTILTPIIDVFIDLPGDLRGIHASRSYESLREMVDGYAGKVMRLEEIAGGIATKLLRLHPYSSRSMVKIRARAFHRVEAPLSRVKSYEPFTIYGKAFGFRRDRGIDVRRFIGVEGYGVTACPCVEEVAEKLYGVRYVTHMQRSVGRLFLEVPRGFEVDALTLLEILQRSMSAPAISNLKREDEVKLVIDAASSPRFAEDCVREMIKRVLERWPNLPDSAEMTASIRSMESLHRQDFMAYIRISAGEARRRLRLGVE
ncbi:MAG: hypothetical protein B6U65_03195 [Candidatus Wolframiiraptor sp. EX4484-121]|nr:MAG: hypothetical protein B6U65_03195 [Candidatus Wolframiiraptor sp. EX4484-121]